MRDDKRKRLEAKGWRTGNAREFLGLTDEEAAYIELSSALPQASVFGAGGGASPRRTWPSSCGRVSRVLPRWK